MNKGVFQMKKQIWKSIFLSLIAIFTLFLLGACGQSTKKGYLQLINQDKKTDIRVIVEYQGDKILSTDSTSVIYYEGTGLPKEQLKKVIDEYDKKFKDVKDSHTLQNTRMTMLLRKQRSIIPRQI